MRLRVIRVGKTEYNDLMGMKKESRVKKVDQFERFIFERENLVFDSLIYLEPVERFKNMNNVMKFRSLGDSTSSRVRKGRRRFVRVAGRLSRR